MTKDAKKDPTRNATFVLSEVEKRVLVAIAGRLPRGLYSYVLEVDAHKVPQKILLID